MTEIARNEVAEDPIKALSEALERIAVLERQVKQLQAMKEAEIRRASGSQSISMVWVK